MLWLPPLKECGLAAHASRLEDTLNGTWTTSSELIAELGSVVLEIRRECSPLTSDQGKEKGTFFFSLA